MQGCRKPTESNRTSWEGKWLPQLHICVSFNSMCFLLLSGDYKKQLLEKSETCHRPQQHSQLYSRREWQITSTAAPTNPCPLTVILPSCVALCKSEFWKDWCFAGIQLSSSTKHEEIHSFTLKHFKTWTQILQMEDTSSPSVLTSKLNIHKDFDKCLSKMGSILVRAEHSFTMKHTGDKWILGLI